MTTKRKRILAFAVLMTLPLAGVFVLQNAKQKALEARFQQDIVASDDPEYRGLSVSFWDKQGLETSLGGWRGNELDEVIGELQIQRDTSQNFGDGRLGAAFYVESGAGDAHPETGIYLSLNGQHSSIGGVRCPPDFNDKFQTYELTPASRQRLFARIQQRWGDELKERSH